MQTKIYEILDFLKSKNVDYADIRVQDLVTENISTENMTVQSLQTIRSKGYGIRVFINGALGFAGSQQFDKMEDVALQAIEIAKASAIAQKEPLILDKKTVVVDEYNTPFKVDPFEVSKTDKLELLFSAEKAMRDSAKLFKTKGFLIFRKEKKIFADTEGSYITQNLMESGGGIEASAADGNDMQIRSYPNSFRGNYNSAGYEYVESLNLVENAKIIAKEAEQLLNAEECPSGNFDLVIDGTQLYLQIHESIGHPIELDRVLGYEAGYAGTSFLNPDMIDNLKYGSEHVNVVADATVPGGLGTFGYDDEGIKAQKTEIITKGIFKGFLSSRDTAPVINQCSNGTSRASSWGRIPIVRMTNINLLPGDKSLDELFNGIEYGLYLKTNKSWSIDDKRLNFQFATEIAYEIKDGKLTGKIFKNPIYTGITPEFWNSCDGVGDESLWVFYGTNNCGKGEPGQVAHVGHGCSPARFRNVKVGVSDVK